MSIRRVPIHLALCIGCIACIGCGSSDSQGDDPDVPAPMPPGIPPGSGGAGSHSDASPGDPGGADGAPGEQGPTTCLNADGPDGVDTYELIDSVLGQGALETPDADHDPPVRHVLEDVDDEVGPHFVFLAHRDIDSDRQINFDRSRVEIGVATSDGHDELKALLGETVTYTWRFRIGADMTFSDGFTILFELRTFQGDDNTPIVRFDARSSQASQAGQLQVIHSGRPSLGTIGDADLDGRKGVWLTAKVTATFAEQGELHAVIETPDGEPVLTTDQTDIDLWRGGDFVRPKWGIYRSRSDQLRPDEENVRFANLAITKGATPSSDCGATTAATP